MAAEKTIDWKENVATESMLLLYAICPGILLFHSYLLRQDCTVPDIGKKKKVHSLSDTKIYAVSHNIILFHYSTSLCQEW